MYGAKRILHFDLEFEMILTFQASFNEECTHQISFLLGDLTLDRSTVTLILKIKYNIVKMYV